jgi:gliding motility-associated-like protein
MKKIYLRILCSLLTISSFSSVVAQVVNAGQDIVLPCNTNCSNITASLQGIQGASNYTVTSEPYSSAQLPYSAGTPVFFGNTDDQWSGAVTLPFTFNFYCQSFNQVWIGSNGEITFTSSSGYCYFPNFTIPTGNLPNYSISAYHRDLWAYATTPTYTTTGTTPNRKFIVNYDNVMWYGGGGYATFQIVLHETTNIIDVFIASSGSTAATIGIQQNSTTGLAPAGRNNATFNPVQEGWRFTPGGNTGAPTVQLTTLTGLLVQNGTPTPVGSNYTVSFINICPSTDTGTYVVEATYACGGTYKDTIKIIKTVTPPPTVTSPVNICQNSTAQPLSAQGQNLLWYTVATGGTGSTTTPTPVTTTPGLDTFWVSQTINGCESVRVPIYINVLVQPVITAGSNSPICAGTTLLLNSTQVTGATYAWTGPNNFSSSFQNPSIGNAQPVNAGTYTVIATLGGCASVPATVTVVITPSPLISTINFTNATQCNGTGTITLSGLTANTTYTVNYTKNGTPQTALTITSSGSGQVVMTNLGPGTYTGITVTINGCVSNIVGPITISQPTPPNINFTSVNPTTCGGTNGSITLTGLVNGQSYVITFTKNGVLQPTITQTASGGSVTIPNLTAGTYTSISVTAVITNCTSNIIPQIILSDPNSPSITVAFTNPTVCNTNTGTITLSGLVNGQSYTINYTKNGTAQPAVTQVASGGAVILSNLGAGSYTGITVTINGCISNVVTATLVDPSGPVILAAGNNPITCNTSTGSIVLNGLVNGMTYTVYFTQNGIAQPSFTQVAAGGAVTIPNLPSGTYTNIYVIINSCTSNTQGPISLVDPSAPATPVVNGNTPLCAGQALNLTAVSTTTGATYNWTGPVQYSSTTQNPTINNIQLNQAGTYTVTATLNGCTSAPASVTVVVNPSPVTPIAGVNNPICQGNSINLTATTTTSGATYDWTGPGGYTAPNTQNPTIPNATTANNGQYTVIASANGCPSLAATVNVSVTATPAIQFTSTNPTACGSNTGSITLNGLLNGSSYIINYSKNGVPQAATTQTAAGGVVTISNLGAGTYSNITVSLNGCPSNIVGPVTLTDPTQPPTPVVSNNGPYCEGDNIQITTGNIQGATWTWSGPGGYNSTVQSPSINNVQVNQGGTYTVVAVVNGCSSQPAGTLVVVNPVPATPLITTGSPICEGSPLPLNSNTITNVTYSWIGPNNFTSSAEDTILNNAQPVMSGVYTLQVSNGSCSSSASATVVVNPIPVAPTVVTPLELCQFEQVQLTAQGQNLLWYTQPTGGTGTPTVTPPSNFATTMTYYVSQTVNGCEGPRAQLDVTIKPQPQMPQAQTNYNYCQDEPVATLSATGTNIQWYTTQTGGTGDTTTPTLSSAVPGIFHYYVTQTINGCESERLDITLMVNTKPDLPIVEQMTLCQDAPVPPFSVQGQNLLWYNTPTGGTGSASLPQINTADTGVTDYYVSQTVNGCEGDRSLIRVTINPKVEAIFITDKDTICDSYPLTVTFTGTAPTTATFDWGFNGGNATGTGAGPYTVSWNDQGTKTITLTVSNLNCTSSTSKTVYVLPTPDPTFNLLSDACPGDKVRVQAAWDQMEMPGYVWNFSGADVLSGSGGGPYTLQWNTPGDKVVSLSLTNIPCPSLPFEKTISIHLPEANIVSVSSDDICAADSVLFSANPGLDYSYQWTPAIYFGKGEVSKGQSVWGTVRMSGYAWLTVTDRWGCSASDSVLMSTKSCCQVFLPNVFSPNNDGKNDVFRMVTKGHQTIKRFIIVNRWGKTVFDTADQNEGWDGSFNGEPQDIGTYQYYLKYECAEGGELMEMKGDVTLLR